MEDLGQAKMGWDALRVQSQAVLEVLLGFDEISLVGEESCEMNSGTKMLGILSEALLAIVNRLFDLLLLFVLLA